MSHLERNRLISPAQHGFVQRKACVTNLLESADFITGALARNRWVDVIYLDFAKSFDTVPHKRLILKLDAYGIKGLILGWISAFLTGRRQRVVLGEECSDWSAVTSGVPQGSVLGPTLFVIYINDITECISNTAKLYADDTKILAEVGMRGEQSLTDQENTLQEDLNRVVDWTRVWLMQLNLEKCKVMHLGRGNPEKEYTMHREGSIPHTLIKTTAERDLGVMVSADMKHHIQTDKATAKGFSVLGQMRKAFVHRGADVWKRLYMTYVRPHLEYAVAAWNPNHYQDIAKLERVQRRATKQVQSLRGFTYEQRCEALGLQKLDQRRIRGDLIQQYKIRRRFDQVSWVDQPPTRPAWGPYPARVVRELTRTTARHEFFTNRVAGAWNCVPQDVKDARSTNAFKQRLDRFIEEYGPLPKKGNYQSTTVTIDIPSYWKDNQKLKL